MDYTKTKLSNGLRVITVPMPSHESVTVTLWVKAGSRDEEKRLNGISHFFEHMAFKGSKKRPTARKVSEAIDSIGGEFNAGTSKEWTNFYVKCRNTHIKIAFDVISDMILNPILDNKEIEKEKGVILEEIALHEDTPVMKIGDLFEELIFEGSPLSRDISGTPESVKAMVRNDILRYIKEHYFAGNILLTVAGRIEEKEVFKLAGQYFAYLKSKTRLAARQGQSGSKELLNKQLKPKVKLKTKKSDQAHLIIGFRGYGKGKSSRFAEAILATILGGGMSSRLFLEVRDKRGLAYSIATSSDHYKDSGYFATYAGVALNKIEEAIKVILSEHKKLQNSKTLISKEELKKAKEFLKGHLALALEDTKDINYFFGEEELLLGCILTPEDVFEKVNKVTIEDVVAVAKDLFKTEKLNLAIIGPYEDKQKFVKLIT